jgi:hypothetical protein
VYMSSYLHRCFPRSAENLFLMPARGNSKSSSVRKESCLQCSKTFLPSFMRKHVLEEHCAPEERTCSKCGSVFKAKNILNRHKRQHHKPTSASISTTTIEAIGILARADSLGLEVEEAPQPQVMLFGAPTIEQLQTPRGALTSPSQYYSGATPFVGLSLSSQLQNFQAFISSESQREQVL